MSSQIGIYEDPSEPLDNWTGLVHLDDDRSPRQMLHTLTPFLKHLSARRTRRDAGGLGAWLIWHLVESGITGGTDPAAISLSRSISSEIDFFYRISPDRVEVYAVDEILEWRVIGALDISGRTVGIQTGAA